MNEKLEYHIALNDLETKDLDKKKWLFDYFELYKTTLIWPPGLPPIKTCGLIEGSLREEFHSTYRLTLSDFEYEFDNKSRTLKFNKPT